MAATPAAAAHFAAAAGKSGRESLDPPRLLLAQPVYGFGRRRHWTIHAEHGLHWLILWPAAEVLWAGAELGAARQAASRLAPGKPGCVRQETA